MLCPRRFLSSLLGGVLILGIGALPAASGPPDSTDLDRALMRVDRLRANGTFQEALTRMDRLRDEYGDRAALLWRASLTQVDAAKTTTEEGEAQRRYRRALQLAETALRIDPSNAHAHLAKAVAEGRIALDAGTKERVRRSRAVKRHADRAIALDSTLAGAYHVRGRWNREVADLNFFERTIVRTVYGGLPDASFEQAVRDFKSALELENVRFHHLELAKTYRKMGRPTDARKHLQTVLDLPKKEYFGDRYKAEAEALLADME